MKKITIALFLLGFLLMRPYTLQNNGWMYMHDDYDYLAHATSIAFGQFPHYNKELWVDAVGYKNNGPHCSIGAGLMAAPFVFVFSQLDRITNSQIFSTRTIPSVTKHSWTQFGFIIATQFYYYLACFLLYIGLKLHFPKRTASWAVILMAVLQFMPLFAFRRPLFSHIYEFVLQSGFVFILLRGLSGQVKEKGWVFPVYWVGVLVGLTVLVRFNNIPIALMWLVVLSLVYEPAKPLRCIGLSVLTAILLIVVFKIYPSFVTAEEGYSGKDMQRFFALESPLFYFKRLWHIFAGKDWGLIFTAPFVLLAFCQTWFKHTPYRKYFLLLSIPLIFNLYGVMMYKTQGAWYGYRYIVPAMIPIMMFPLAYFLETQWKKTTFLMTTLIAALSLIAVMPMLLFEGNASTLTLERIIQYFGVRDWSNNTYIWEVWKVTLTQPKEFIIAALKGGPLYLIYVAAQFTGFADKLPGVVMDKYSVFSFITLIKMGICYLLPFMVALGIQRNRINYD